MVDTVQAIRGMNDGLPQAMPYWHKIEAACRAVAASYAYDEIRPPIVEKTQLFKRSIGEVTDIVEKEMYTFTDRNGDQLSLRPEGTAGCVRAGLEHGLLYNQIQRLWYMGPMFRRERPQKGRTRQFHQFGIEAFGMAGPAIDAEIILMSARLWELLGMQGQFRLELNSLGTSACRQAYRESLVAYLSQHADLLDEDSQRRLQTNPLRILDSKNPALQDLIAAAPKLSDCWCEQARLHFEQLCDLLDQAGLSFTINPHLVRGLDYYALTVFEWVTDQLGAQGTVAAGGRYDRLVDHLGGKKPVPAVGFALGLERLQLLLQQSQQLTHAPQLYMVLLDPALQAYGLMHAEALRTALPGLELAVDLSASSAKSQFRRAAQSGARWAVVCGEQEQAADVLTLKDLRQDKEQQQFSGADLIAFLQQSVDTL